MQFLFGRKVSCPLQCDLSLIFHLAFVSNQVDAHVLACMLPDLVKPIRQVGKCLLICYVIGKENRMSPTVEDARHRLEGFLSRLLYNSWYCIPNLQLDGLIIDSDHLCSKLHTNRHLMFLAEAMIYKLEKEARFADA